tara:strand:+ start:209 stop:493 length:285 start_codon:yes stop_codon:yes gene_type:complete
VNEEKKNKILDLLETTEKKSKEIRAGSAFVADFESADLLDQLANEIRLLVFANKSLKKLVEHNKLLLLREDVKNQTLEHENSLLAEALMKCEKC